MKRLSVSFLFTLLLSTYALPQNTFHFGVDGGLSKITSANGDVWNLGFYVNGYFFNKLTRDVNIGIQVAYHRWTPNEAGYSSYGEVSGAGSYLEVMPYLSLTLYQGKGLEFFIQAGGGVTFIKIDVDVRVLWFSIPVQDSSTRGGIFFGLGARLGNVGKVRFGPIIQYHNTFIEGGSTGYVTGGLGISY